MAVLPISVGGGYLAVSVADPPAQGQQFLLMTDDQLAAVQAKAAGNTSQWQAFETRLDNLLGTVVESEYQSDQMQKAADFAMGYLALKESDPTQAARYADKAIAVAVDGMRNDSRAGYSAKEYVGRGDGATTTFSLPADKLDNINTTGFAVYLLPTLVVAMTKGTANGQDSGNLIRKKIIKVSNTSDGPANYTERSITSRTTNPYTWGAGDWRRNPEYRDDYIDWNGASSQPANGATYYCTVANYDNEVAAQNPANYSVNTGAGTVTFNTPPTSSQCVFVRYQYGTFTSGASTLGYQQTKFGGGGRVCAIVDVGYPSRSLRDLGYVYDWLYDYPGLTTALKQEMEVAMLIWTDQIKSSPTYQINSPASNYGAGHVAMRTAFAAALQKRGHAQGDALVAEVLQYRADNTLTKVTGTPPLEFDTRKGNYVGGVWMEGLSYGPFAIRNVLHPAAVLETAGLATVSQERTWAGQVIKATLHGSSTNRNYTDGNGSVRAGEQCDFGDWFTWPPPMPDKQMWPLLAHMSDDADATAAANHFLQNANGPTIANFEDLLWRDPGATAANWTGTFPPHYYSSGPGVVFARASWTYASSAWWSFHCGNDPVAEHQAHCVGFMLVSRGPDHLLVRGAGIPNHQAGTGSNEGANWANVVVCDDGGAGVQNYRYNHGAWYGDPGVQMLGTDLAADYVYACGDSTPIYSINSNAGNGGSMDELQRSILFVRPDKIFVLDRATSKNTAYTKQLRWHMATVNGSSAPSLASPNFSHQYGSSKIFGTILSPQAITLTTSGPLAITGGATTSWSHTDNGVSYSKSVYRVQAELSSPALKVRFVTVLQTAASAVGAGDGATLVQSSSGGHLVGAISGNTLVLFGEAAGPVATPKSYTFTAPSGTTAHHVCDLTPNTFYSLTGADQASATSSAAGVLAFTSSTSGSHTVTIT